MSEGEIHVGDTGTVLEVTIRDGEQVVDLSEASVKQFRLRNPNNETRVLEAQFFSDGTDGKLRYVTQADDLDIRGAWAIQAYVVLPGGAWHSDVTTFDVIGNI